MRKLVTIASAILMVFGLLVAFMPVSAAVPPLVFHSRGAASNSVGFLNIALPTTATDAIVVVEWIGVLLSTPCAFILTPSDGFSNAYSAIGNCLPDSNGGAIQAFTVSSNSQTGTDTVSCNFGSPNTNVEACYAFDVNSPGAITLLASATGISSGMAVGSSNAVPNALILATAGIQLYCQAVVGGDTQFQQYIPSSTCNSGGGAFQYGLAGGLENIGPGGFTSTFPMTMGQIAVWSELVVQVAPAASTTTTTVYTATITGYLVPDTTHLGNTLVFILFSLGGMVGGIFPFTLFYRNQTADIGDRAIYPGLIGLLLGSVLGDLTTTPQTAPAIPFADLLVAGMLLFLWWWNS